MEQRYFEKSLAINNCSANHLWLRRYFEQVQQQLMQHILKQPPVDA